MTFGNSIIRQKGYAEKRTQNLCLCGLRDENSADLQRPTSDKEVRGKRMMPSKYHMTTTQGKDTWKAWTKFIGFKHGS